ncbi:MAG: thiS [Massilia sp.]|nr:thiS [Massilia sp.]
MDTLDSQACEFTLNGAPHALAAGSTLFDLIDALALQDQALALAVNRSVVPRRQWIERAIAPGDRVEVVRAIGGG